MVSPSLYGAAFFMMPPSVILNEVKNLASSVEREKSRFFASLRMTGEREQNGQNGQNDKKCTLSTSCPMSNDHEFPDEAPFYYIC